MALALDDAPDADVHGGDVGLSSGGLGCVQTKQSSGVQSRAGQGEGRSDSRCCIGARLLAARESACTREDILHHLQRCMRWRPPSIIKRSIKAQIRATRTTTAPDGGTEATWASAPVAVAASGAALRVIMVAMRRAWY